MHVKPADPRANYIKHKSEIDQAIEKVLGRGRYILGDEVNSFEEEFAEYIGVPYGVGVASGTDALHVALRACDIGLRDEVITVSHTAVATIAAVELSGANPVLVDIDPESYTINPEAISRAISPRTKAIIPVHLYGCPAAMDKVMEIARKYSLLVIEDCAQSHGAMIEGKITGSWGDASAYSFYPTKNLGALGDGGIVLTNKREIFERLVSIREYGWKERYISHEIGLNSRLDELQAAILRVKLRYLEQENMRRREIAAIYEDGLGSVHGLILPATSRSKVHVYHQYVIQNQHRDKLQEFLKENGIITLIHYPLPIHLQPAYQGRISVAGDISTTESVAASILSLPIYPELESRQVESVIAMIKKWFRKYQ